MRKEKYQYYPDFLTANEVAELLNLPLSTVLKKIREGIIPVHYIGKPYRVYKGDLYGKPKDPRDTRAEQRAKNRKKKK